MPGAERHTKVLTNVWAHQVLTCLACVDTTRVINTNKQPDKQRKLLDLNCLPVVICFDEIPNWLKKLGCLPNWLESLSSYLFHWTHKRIVLDILKAE